jgi:hypothetical protein
LTEIDDRYLKLGIVTVDDEGQGDLTALGEQFGINMFLISQAKGKKLSEWQVIKLLKITGMGTVNKENKISPTQKLYDWTWYLITNNKVTPEMEKVINKKNLSSFLASFIPNDFVF